MKRVSFLLLALLVAIPSFTQTIYLDKFADKSVIVEFNKLQKITFDNDNLYIHMKSGVVTPYSLYYYTIITNSVNSGLSVDDIEAKEELVSYLSGDVITVNAPAGTIVEIFSVCGAQVASLHLDSDNGSISISTFAKGIYILRANGRTSKFLKR